MENIYKILEHFNELYDIISDEEKKELIATLVKEIQIYPEGESEMPLKSMKFNFPVYKDGKEVREIFLNNNTNVDNLGVRGADGKIFWTDDLHLLPFDGIADWSRNAKMLKNFDGPLTAELKFCDVPDCSGHDYRAMKFDDYLAEALSRLRKIESLIG